MNGDPSHLLLQHTPNILATTHHLKGKTTQLHLKLHTPYDILCRSMVQHHPSKRLKLHHEVIGGARLDSSGIKPCCFATRHPKKGEKKYWNIIEPWCPTLHLSRNPLKAGTGHQRSMKITLGIAREVCFRGYSSYMFLEGDGGKMAK